MTRTGPLGQMGPMHPANYGLRVPPDRPTDPTGTILLAMAVAGLLGILMAPTLGHLAAAAVLAGAAAATLLVRRSPR